MEIERTQDVLSWDVKSDKAGGILEDFHNERWMDGIFFGRKQNELELWDPLFSRCTYIAAGWTGWDGMEGSPARPGLAYLNLGPIVRPERDLRLETLT